jgi:hypothetical protein
MTDYPRAWGDLGKHSERIASIASTLKRPTDIGGGGGKDLCPDIEVCTDVSPRVASGKKG